MNKEKKTGNLIARLKFVDVGSKKFKVFINFCSVLFFEKSKI